MARAFVQIVQAQTGQRRQITDVVRRPRVSACGQGGKTRIGGAQGVVTQRVLGQRLGALLAAPGAKKIGQQRAMPDDAK